MVGLGSRPRPVGEASVPGSQSHPHPIRVEGIPPGTPVRPRLLLIGTAPLAEADGNRARLRALARTPVLKFGGGRVAECDLVPADLIESRSGGIFVPSAPVL